MDDTKFLRRFESLIEAPAGSLTGEDNLAGLPGWDSLAVLAFIAMMDQEWGLVVRAVDIERCRTVGDLRRLANITRDGA